MNITNLSNKHNRGIFTLILILGLGLAPLISSAQTAGEKSFKKQFEKQRQKFSRQFREDFKAYKATFRKEWEMYRRAVRKEWGYAEVSTAKKHVVYSADKVFKVVVDYEKNRLTSGYSKVVPDWEARLTTFIAGVLRQTAGHTTIAESVGIPVQNIDAIAQQLASSSEFVSSEEAKQETANDLVRTAEKILMASATEEDPRQKRSDERYAASLTLESRDLMGKTDPRSKDSRIKKLDLTDSRWEKALRFAELVQSQANQYGLSQALIYAVIETESSFNPNAISPIPAFGLMLVAPSTVGVDVHRHLKKKDSIPKQEQLFDARNNLLYGATYLDMLSRRYFKGVTHRDNRTLCVIAAYNAGAPVVAKTLNNGGEMSLRLAAQSANSMQADSLKAYLIERLPAKETSRYMIEVTDAMSFFQQKVKER